MSRPYAFIFWESSQPTPDYLELCFKTQNRNLVEPFELIRLNFESCKEWVPERDYLMHMCEPRKLGHSPSLESRRWSIFCDLLRIALITKYGGVWIDADTLILPQFSLLADLIPEFNLIASEQEEAGVANGILAARPDSPFFTSYYEHLLEHLETKAAVGDTKARWGEYGFSMLRNLIVDWEGDDLYILPFGMVIPFDSQNAEAIFADSSEFTKFVPVTALGLSFFNNLMDADHRTATEQTLIAADTIFSHTYQLAMADMPPTNNYFVLSNSKQLWALNRAPLVRSVATKMLRKNNHLEIFKEKLKKRNEEIRRLKPSPE